MDKESGVYLTINDNSFQSGGTSSLKSVITMLTTKGELGMNYVTAETFKNVLGYDLDYNSNYLGLAKMLEKVSYAYVWRLNQNAKLANLYFMTDDPTKQSDEGIGSFEDIINKDPSPIIAVANKNVGNPGTNAIKFAPTPDNLTIANNTPAGSNPQEIIIDDASENETTVLSGETIKSACIFYDSSNTSIVGVIKENPEGELKVYRVVDGEILSDEITVDEFNVWSDGTTFFNSMLQETTEPQGDPEPAEELGDVTSANYDILTNAWELQGVSYDSNKSVITPLGTKGSGTNIGDFYIADNTSQHLTPGNWYATNDGGNTFYTVAELGETWAECSVQAIDPSETDVLAELADIYTGGDFDTLTYYLYTNTLYTGMYEKKNTDWFKVTSFATTQIVTMAAAETDQNIINALNDSSATTVTISYIKYVYEYTSKVNAIGDVTWENNQLTIVLYGSPSKDSYWNLHIIPTDIKNWTLYVSEFNNRQYLIKSTNYISTDPESEIYWKNVPINDIQIDIKSIPSTWDVLRDWQTLDNGDNGDKDIVATDIDVSPLETTSCNTLFTNGITNYRVINRIAAKAEQRFIHTFADAPAFGSYIDLENWKKNIYESEYLVIGTRPDQVEIDSKGTTVIVYPSVNYLAILANMIEQQGSLCYPPAGLTYGPIEVENLIECDYENYGNELKTNRLNWQRYLSRGPVMWEQRTMYSLDTDLSYIAPVFIVDDVRDQIIALEEQFTFRYMSPTDLLNQESGLTGILDDFLTRGLLYSYTLNVPTYEEAQKAGRTLEIPISIVITKDAEVIEIILTLNNA